MENFMTIIISETILIFVSGNNSVPCQNNNVNMHVVYAHVCCCVCLCFCWCDSGQY